eukprot:18021-Heterococcus_DN1.PRE.1
MSNWLYLAIPLLKLSSDSSTLCACLQAVGMRTACHLARLGATVIMACKSEAKGAAAKIDIINELKQKHDMNNASLEVSSAKFMTLSICYMIAGGCCNSAYTHLLPPSCAAIPLRAEQATYS